MEERKNKREREGPACVEAAAGGGQAPARQDKLKQTEVDCDLRRALVRPPHRRERAPPPGPRRPPGACQDRRPRLLLRQAAGHRTRRRGGVTELQLQLTPSKGSSHLHGDMLLEEGTLGPARKHSSRQEGIGGGDSTPALAMQGRSRSQQHRATDRPRSNMEEHDLEQFQ
jgi:hypothetical protein